MIVKTTVGRVIFKITDRVLVLALALVAVAAFGHAPSASAKADAPVPAVRVAPGAPVLADAPDRFAMLHALTLSWARQNGVNGAVREYGGYGMVVGDKAHCAGIEYTDLQVDLWVGDGAQCS